MEIFSSSIIAPAIDALATGGGNVSSPATFRGNIAAVGYETNAASFTAKAFVTHSVTASSTVTNPTPAQGMFYRVLVRNGTVTMPDAATYSVAGTEILALYHSGAWSYYPNYGAVSATTSAPGVVGGLGGTTITNAATVGQIAGRGRSAATIIWTDFLGGGISGNNIASDGYNFASATSGTGSAVGKLNAATGNAIGVAVLETGTTTTGRAAIDTFGGNNTVSYGAGEVSWESRVFLPNLADATDDYSIAIGHCAVNNATFANDGCAFTYNRASTGGNWQAISRSGGSQTTTDTGVAVAANAWVKLGFVVNAGGTSVSFFINGVSVATITTNIATVAGREGAFILKSAGTTSRTLRLDYWLTQQTFTSQR